MLELGTVKGMWYSQLLRSGEYRVVFDENIS